MYEGQFLDDDNSRVIVPVTTLGEIYTFFESYQWGKNLCLEVTLFNAFEQVTVEYVYQDDSILVFYEGSKIAEITQQVDLLTESIKYDLSIQRSTSVGDTFSFTVTFEQLLEAIDYIGVEIGSRSVDRN
jgi:hypothetical protein